jgi:pantoate--beta-alanine ligase
VRVLSSSEASAVAEGRWFWVYGRSWLRALAPHVARAAQELGISRVLVLPDGGEPDVPLEEALVTSLAEAGLEALYAPASHEFWPRECATRVVLEGSFRRHGVAYRHAHYVERATAAVRTVGLLADASWWEFGSDYHWIALWRRVQQDLALSVRHTFLPPPREEDGLLVRPENGLLARWDRQAAGLVYGTLCEAEELFRSGEVEATRLLGRTSAKLMRIPGYRVQYLSLADPDTLAEREIARPGDVLLVGGFFGSVRLEDYLVLS